MLLFVMLNISLMTIDVSLAGVEKAGFALMNPRRRHEWRRALTPHRKPFVGRPTVDLALDGEDRIDALHRFERERRNDRRFPRTRAVTSASTKNLRLLCDQHAASMSGPGLRASS